MIPVKIENIEFKNGELIHIDDDDIIIIVGPNNSGKSKLLEEVTKQIQSPQINNLIIDHIEIKKHEDTDSIIEMLLDEDRITISYTNSHTQKPYNIEAPKKSFEEAWDKDSLGLFTKVFVNHITTVQRLTAVIPPRAVAMRTSEFSHPIHFLQRDDKLEHYFSEIFRQAFDQDLILNHRAGNTVPLHVGERPKVEENEDRASLSYIQKIEKLPLLHDQGDGMKSFVGVLLHTLVTNYVIVLIDEPESFLHPPQARLLGKMIGEDLPNDRQLILATHSGDFLRGLLDSAESKLRILRIERDGNTNIISELNPREVDEIWNDSLLRHSNVLDGIFHTKVILCESDSDCRFYSVMFDQLLTELKESARDYMFIHCGGKHRFPKVLSALNRLKVPIEIIADIDILNNKEPLKTIVSELDGDWDAIEGKWRIVFDAINSKKPELETEDVKKEIQSVLDQVNEPIFPKDKAQQIKTIIKKSSVWGYAKASGKAFIPRGDATSSFNELAGYLSELGLHIVEVGELEGFYRNVGGHGPKWVEEVLKKDLSNDPEFEPVKSFLKKII